MIETQIRNLIIAFEEHFEHYFEKTQKIVCKKDNQKKKLSKLKNMKDKAENELYLLSENTISILMNILKIVDSQGLKKINNQIEKNINNMFQ